MRTSSIKSKIFAAIIILAVWKILSLIYPPLIVPKIGDVAKKIISIISEADLLTETSKTILRLFMGLFFGITLGFITGFICGIFKNFREICKPILAVLQVIPPVAILVLAIIWLGFSGKPAVLIVSVAIFPTIAISVQDSMLGINKKLVEMGTVFRFSKKKMLSLIIWPSVKMQFYSALKIALGIAVKTVIMGEVLTTSSGIGGQITTARLNLESETVIAWTVIAVCIYYFFDIILALPFKNKAMKF